MGRNQSRQSTFTICEAEGITDFYLYVKASGTVVRLASGTDSGETLTATDLTGLVGGKPNQENVIGCRVVFNEDAGSLAPDKVFPEFNGDVVVGKKTDRHEFAGFPPDEFRALEKRLAGKKVVGNRC